MYPCGQQSQRISELLQCESFQPHLAQVKNPAIVFSATYVDIKRHLDFTDICDQLNQRPAKSAEIIFRRRAQLGQRPTKSATAVQLNIA